MKTSFLTCLLALALCGVTACTTWRVQQAPPAQVLAIPRDQVRLTLSDRSIHTVQAARIEGDQVVGVRPRSAAAGAPVEAVSYPLDEVQRVELSEINYDATVWVSAAFLAILLIMGAFAASGTL